MSTIFIPYPMPQKHHQEEISGPLDTIEAASLAKDLPRPKRARIQSRKARENGAQSQPFEVLSLRPAVAPKKRAHREASEASSVNAPLNTTPNQRQPPNSQNSSQQASSQAANREKKEEWQIQLEST
jgi:hypothetical protein